MSLVWLTSIYQKVFDFVHSKFYYYFIIIQGSLPNYLSSSVSVFNNKSLIPKKRKNLLCLNKSINDFVVKWRKSVTVFHKYSHIFHRIDKMLPMGTTCFQIYMKVFEECFVNIPDLSNSTVCTVQETYSSKVGDWSCSFTSSLNEKSPHGVS